MDPKHLIKTYLCVFSLSAFRTYVSKCRLTIQNKPPGQLQQKQTKKPPQH